MNKYLCWIFGIVVVSLIYKYCNPKTKTHYILTTNVNNYNRNDSCPDNLYREYYRVYRSYLASDVNSVYLTDSAKFRLFLGLYDDEEFIDCKCNGDTVIITKSISTSNAPEWNFPKVVNKKVYSLKQLQTGQKFEWKL